MLNDAGLDLIFRDARTHNAWQDKPVSETLLRAVHELAKMGPTSANTSPLRVLFIASPEAKEKLKPALSGGNQDKTMAAPVTAIFAHDLKFYERLGELFPHNPNARSWFAGKPDVIQETAFRNGTLQAAYFMLAARAVGLDCGPMSGFDKDMVNRLFFADGTCEANFLCNLGYGDATELFPRSPRPTFDDVCQIL